MEVVVERLTDLSPGILSALVADSERDGWRFVRRLADEWASGVNRFDRPGERLFAAQSGGAVLGVGGLNVDPYAADPTVGRVRRLYVLRAHRGRGVGRELVHAIIRAAAGRFRRLRLRTESPDAARFYERLGFRPAVGASDCTHTLDLGKGATMSFTHTAGVKPTPGSIELGRGADGIVVEVLDHPELVVKDMNHPFKLGRNRVALELRVLHAVRAATKGEGATEVFNHGTDEQERSWLVRERVFDVEPRGSQEDRDKLIEIILGIHPSADVNRLMLRDPTFDNVRWGYTEANREPRWILIDP
jgi:GNAT superfamily N-acetyltransferase